MSLWIIATLAAAAFQTMRFMLQKVLSKSTLSPTGATFARFFYSAPLVVMLLFAWLWSTGQTLPALSAMFWAYGALGGFTQILATVFVVALFKERNFAVGITFKKTEAIQTVLVGLVILGEGVSVWGFLAILLGLFGVLLLSDPPGGSGPLWHRFANRAAGLGLASGILFAVSGVTYRAASLELAVDQPLLRAGITLAAVTSMQLSSMTLWLWEREPGEMARVWAARRTAGFVGLTSMAGSFCWFTAFTVQNAAYVKALGQIELIFSLMASVLVFKERITRREILGIAVLGGSILTLVLVI